MKNNIISLVICILFSSCSSNRDYEQMVLHFEHSAPIVSNAKPNIYFLETPLSRSELIETVILVNPSLESARQAWSAMISEYPQAVSYDDPLAGYSFAPGTVNSKKTNFGQEIDISQKIPFPGKLRTRGKMALARASSLGEDYEWAKVQLAQTSSNLYDDYYYIARALEISNIHIKELKEIKDSANAQCASGKVSTQIPLQADLELAQLEYEQISLVAEQEIIVSKLNALLHRSPNSEIPSPPKLLCPHDVHETAEQLNRIALQNRPDLKSICAQIEEAQAAVNLAHLNYYPDFQVGGSYNTMWPIPQMRTTIGVGINIPIQFSKRKAAVNQTKSLLKSLADKHLSLKDQIFSEISNTLSKIYRSKKYVQILQESILPDAVSQYEAVRNNFETGQASLIAVIESEKNLRSLELQLHSVIAELYRQLANLDQSVGYILHFSLGDISYE